MASKKRLIIGCVLAAILIIIIVVVLCVVFLVVLKKEDKPSSKTDTNGGPYKHAVVAADNGVCSDLGKDILKRNGSAVDSAITVMFCLGVMSMHSSGIGGGGFMLVYKRATKTAEVIDFREEAPGAANSTMYEKSSLSSKLGPSASGVPGEVRGYRKAWEKYGRLKWADLVQPVIDMASKGVPLSKATYKAMSMRKDLIRKDPGLSEIFIKNGTFIKEGDLMNLTKLAKTLEIIRDDPEDFYTGKLAEQLVKDIQGNGGIITLEDMKNYAVKVRPAVQNVLGDQKWYSVPPPGSGAVLGMILNILKGYKMTPDDRVNKTKAILAYHRIIEAFKFSYAWRTRLGDYENVTQVVDKMINLTFADSIRQKINDNKTYTNTSYYGDFFGEEDGGSTTHMSLLASNGDAVGITSTVNYYFGSKYRSVNTGIIMNNQMDDFSMPGNSSDRLPSPFNLIEPRKRPLSSSSPFVITKTNGGVHMVCGASGGMTITTATALTVMNYLWFGRTLSQSVEDPRLHHQLVPMYVVLDKIYPFDKEIVDGLKTLGHTFNLAKNFTSVVQAVARGDDGLLYGKSDPRKGGHSAGF